jgi:hypothetical protein
MVRSASKRTLLTLLLASAPAVLVFTVLVALALPTEFREQARITLPTLLFVVLAVSALAPIAAGGATDLFPADQLVNYPITATTRFAAGLALMPINLAWVLQILTLVLVGVYGGSGTGQTSQLMICLALFALVATAVGQALAWLTIGSRSTPAGRLVTTVLGAVAVLALVALVFSGEITRVADRSPLLRLVAVAFSDQWWILGLYLIGLGLVAFVIGVRICAWAGRRVLQTSGIREERRHTRRQVARSPLASLVAMERGSVIRSTPIRRGLAFLIVVPPLTAALARLGWDQLVILPGLVAAGTGLLYGINVFALDAGGALWLAASPHDQQLLLLAKARVLIEVCLAATVSAVAVSMLSAAGTPSWSDLVAVGAAVLGSTTWVVGTCLRLSARQPHPAALRGPRDAPAPPGVMTVHSVRLAAGTGCIGLSLVVAASLDSAALALVVGASAVVLGARKIAQTDRLWGSQAERARIVTTVAGG